MKTNKNLKEAIFRAPETTDENKQPQQEQLYHMGATANEQQKSTSDQPQDLVNESHINRMATFQNLREMEYDVEKKINRKKE